MMSTKNTILALSLLTLIGIFFAYQNLLPELKMAAVVVQSEKSSSVEELTTSSSAVIDTSEGVFVDFLALAVVEETIISSSTPKMSGSEITTSSLLELPEAPTPPAPLTLADLLHLKSSDARNENGLSALILSTQLSQSAKSRSDDMTENDYLSHTSLSGCNLKCHWIDSGIQTLTWGENLAEFTPYSEALSNVIADTLITRWLESSGHRQNLLSSSFTHYGIGISVKGERLVVTMIFGNL